jgi:hypothetical protein
MFLMLFVSCKKSERKDQVSISDDLREKVKAKRNLYLSLQHEALNEHGYAHKKCDSIGFTALCKASQGCKDANLYASEDNGRWYRSPEKDCFDKGESKSDISKDMALMLFIAFYETKDLDALHRFRSYAEANNYIMGRPSDNAEGISRVLMTPGLILTMQRLDKKLSGLEVPADPDDSDRALPVINKGFQAHLDILSIWLNGELTGKVSSSDQFVLRSQVERQPRNALFQAVYHLYEDGDQTKAFEILADENLFPSDRLPTSKDRCEEYLFQRDFGADWQSCDEEQVQ